MLQIVLISKPTDNSFIIFEAYLCRDNNKIKMRTGCLWNLIPKSSIRSSPRWGSKLRHLLLPKCCQPNSGHWKWLPNLHLEYYFYTSKLQLNNSLRRLKARVSSPRKFHQMSFSWSNMPKMPAVQLPYSTLSLMPLRNILTSSFLDRTWTLLNSTHQT